MALLQHAGLSSKQWKHWLRGTQIKRLKNQINNWGITTMAHVSFAIWPEQSHLKMYNKQYWILASSFHCSTSNAEEIHFDAAALTSVSTCITRDTGVTATWKSTKRPTCQDPQWWTFHSSKVQNMKDNFRYCMCLYNGRE